MADETSDDLNSVRERVLIIDGDASVRDACLLALSAEGFEATAVADERQAAEAISESTPEIVLCGIDGPNADAAAQVGRIARLLRNATIIATGTDRDDLARRALDCGALDHLATPFDHSALVFAMARARDRQQILRSNRLLRREMAGVLSDPPIVAASEAMIALLETIERASSFESSVLLHGETGVGKEVLARAIHAQSTRRSYNFVTVRCSHPKAQLEADLFGRPRTRVELGEPGLLVEADGGSVFLDEVGALPPALQERLLGVLEEEQLTPAGDFKPRAVDVRVLSASSRDLETEVADGHFDGALLQRLAVINLEIPSLRQRRRDIPLLVDHFLEHFRDRLGKDVRGIADNALERLVAYRWPGNIGQLRNAIEWAVMAAQSDRVTLRDLPRGVVSPAESDRDGLEDMCLKRARRALEADLIQRALKATGGNRTHAAKRLEISHRALLYKIKEYGIR